MAQAGLAQAEQSCHQAPVGFKDVAVALHVCRALSAAPWNTAGLAGDRLSSGTQTFAVAWANRIIDN